MSISTGGLSRLEKSVEEFKATLKPEDHNALRNYSDPNAEDVASFVKDLDSRLQQKQKRRKTLQSSSFATFVRSMQQFAGIVDTCVQSNPEIAALVWGGMKFVLLAFSNYLSYLEEIVDMCDKMGRICPQFERFSKIFPNHKELQAAICDFYAIVVDFFREALVFLYSSVLRQLAISTFRPFEEKFGGILKSLDLAKETIDKEITLSSEQELHIERINNAQLRTDVRDLCQFTRMNYQYFRDDRITQSDEAKRTKRDRVLQNISRYPYYSDFTNNLQKRLENSGLWIYKTPEYKSWLASSNSSGLWYHAIPGFGKSVLTSGIIDSLLELSKTPSSKKNYVAYFFCTYTTPSSLLAHTILSSLLHQLLYYSRDLPQNLIGELESRFEDKITSSRVVLSDIQRYLTQVIAGNKANNYIVVDGLDECNDKERGIVLRTLNKLMDDVSHHLRILISSRGSQDMIRSLKTFQQLDLGASNQQDIEAFISRTLQDKELEGQLPELSENLLGKVKSFLADNAKGLFIWVDLQIEEICKEARPEDIEAVLPTLPKDLDELYDRVVARIVRLRHPEVAQEIFKWVAYAIRPLTLKEIKEATCLKDPQVSSWAVLQRVSDVDEPKWLQNCENLVVVNKANGTVQFAHSTIKEFLVSQKCSETTFHIGETCHLQLAEACVEYYKFPEIIGPNVRPQQTTVSKKNFDALAMLANNSVQNSLPWASWISQKLQTYNLNILTTTTSSSISNAIVRRDDSTIIASHIQTFKYCLRKYPFLEYATSSWLIHHVSSFNGRWFDHSPETSRICRQLLQRFDSIRFPWQSYFTPESVTFEESLYELFDWALENRIFYVFESFWEALMQKSIFQDELSVSVFIRYWLPISPNPGGLDELRFEKLCFGKDFAGEKIWSYINSMIRSDVSASSRAFPGYPGGRLSKQPDYLLYLLGCACERANKPLFDELIKIYTLLPGVRIRDRFCSSKYLALGGYEDMIRKSIAGDSFDILIALQGDEYLDFIQEFSIETKFDLLHSVADVGNAKYFALLMERHSGGLNGTAPDRSSLIQKACEIGEADIVTMCLRRESDLKLRSQTNLLYPIQLAAKNNHVEVIKILMRFSDKKYVDLTARGTPSALGHAIMNRNAEMVEILLDYGASLESTALSVADVERELLSLGPDTSISDILLAKRREEYLGWIKGTKIDSILAHTSAGSISLRSYLAGYEGSGT